MDFLFEHANILIRKNGKYQVLKNHYLGIDQDTIVYIGEELPKEEIKCRYLANNKLIIPGLINAHGHSPMTLLRGVGTGLSLQDWLFTAIFPIEEKLTPYDVEIGASAAIMEMLSSGTTTFAEMYDFPYRSALAVAKSGIKSNVTRVGLCFNDDFDKENDQRMNECLDLFSILYGDKDYNEETKKELDSVEDLSLIREAVKKDLIRVDLCLHSEYLTKEIYIKTILEKEKYHYGRQVHASETKKEVEECIARHGITPIKYLEQMGYLKGGRTYIAHCVHVTDDDLDIIKNNNATIVYNPASNMKLGSGFAPIKKALDKNINVALGTDGAASNDSLDMFKEMHLAALLNAGINNDPTAISVDKILDMATINGAKALGRKDIGEIKLGYKADLVVIDFSMPNLLGSQDYKTALVYDVNPSNVILTMVNGKVLYENGKFYTLDKEKISQQFNEILTRLYK